MVAQRARLHHGNLARARQIRSFHDVEWLVHYRERNTLYPEHKLVKSFCIPSSSVLEYETVKPASSAAGVRVLHKTVDILDALRRETAGLSLADLTVQVGLPKPTVYRILATLESRGYLDRSPAGNYSVARKLYEAPRDTSFEQRLVKAARPAMEKLNETSKETLNLGVLDGGEVLVIHTLESPLAVRMSSKIGNRRHPHCTALGKVLLAGLPEREALRIVRSKGMPALTGRTITQEAALRNELERVRNQGWALDNMENEPDGRCIAAPVFDEGRVIAALSISGPLPRMTSARAKDFLPGLIAACRSIRAGAR
jgi:IclR family acetate operon transcriptional repressor